MSWEHVAQSTSPEDFQALLTQSVLVQLSPEAQARFIQEPTKEQEADFANAIANLSPEILQALGQMTRDRPMQQLVQEIIDLPQSMGIGIFEDKSPMVSPE